MKSCCGHSPKVWIENKWVCSECGALSEDKDTQMDFSDAFAGFDYKMSKPKCVCGSEKTHGSDATHSTWCDAHK